MSKKQKTLEFFGLTKTIKHRENLVKVDIPEETKENCTFFCLLVCNYYDEKFKNTSRTFCAYQMCTY